MKKLLLGLTIICVCVASSWADAENRYREFTSKDGRTLEARILEYDSRADKVKLERHGKGIVQVKPSVFSDADQIYIQSWIKRREFLLPNKFEVTVEKISDGEREGIDSGDRKQFHYELKMKNKSDPPFSSLVVQYNIYIHARGNEIFEDHIRIAGGEVTVESLGSQNEITINTGKETLVEYTMVPHRMKVDETLMGVWIKVFSSTNSGEELSRDLYLPDNIDGFRGWTKPEDADLESLEELVKALPSSLEKGRKVFTSIFYKEISPKLSDETEVLRLNKTSEILDVLMGKGLDVEDYKGSISWKAGRDLFEREAYELAIKWLTHGADKGNVLAYYLLASIYSSATEKSLHDGEMAVEYASLYAEEPYRGEEVFSKEILARAYARVGRYDEAVKMQKEVIQLAEKKKCKCTDVKQLKARLELYNQNRPFTMNIGDDEYYSTPCFTGNPHED